MPPLRSVALVQAHQRIQPASDYYAADLVELCALAAAVRDAVDDVWIPVSPHDRDPLAAFERFARRHRPALVGISAFTAGANSARQYAAIARRHDAVVVLGGFHPSALPDETLANSDVDVVVRGEGELTLRELIERETPEDVAGVSYRGPRGVVHNPPRPPIADLDALPRPWREIRPARFGLAGLDYHTDTIFASRGCRGRCAFCANDLVGGAWRGRSDEAVVEELLTLPTGRRGRAKVVKFWDSNFLTSPERVADLCDRIIALGLHRHFRFVVETRVEDVVRAAALLKRMREAGFVRIGCGVESPSRETHRRLDKGINLAHVGHAAELLAAARIRFNTFLIVGHDGETEADILAYPDYALSHGADMQKATFFVMTPYPGTRLAEDYGRRGMIASRDWDLYTNFGAVVSPDGISADRLQVLHAAVAVRYGLGRRFLEGHHVLASLGRLAEPSLLLAMILLQRGDLTSDQVAERMMDALVAAAGRVTRDRSRRRRPLDRVAVAFHHPGRDPVTIRITAEDGYEVLVVGPAGAADGGLTLHLATRDIVRVVERLDFRTVGNDLGTLKWRPTAFRAAWLPALARVAAVVATAGIRTAALQVRAVLR